MFQGELFAGKRLLPAFGGAAYVWCTCILFFQLVLIVGYYSSRALSAADSKTRTWILALLGMSGLLTLTPRLPQAAWLPPELQPLAALQPFAGLSVALFTTTPLLHRRQADLSDYKIYAWSNAGAFLGLLAYPFVVEPLTPLWIQNLVWAVGGLLIATIGLAGATVAANPATNATATTGTRWQWWVLPALSSAILLATTNRLSYEASAGPLTWALPLAVFLFTYVVAFGARGVPLGVTAILGLAVLAVSFMAFKYSLYMLLMILSAGGAAMLACNGWLAATRNENSHGFYRATAIGGAVGSAIVVLLVPRITTWPVEFPILVIGSLAFAGIWGARKILKPVVAAAAIAAICCAVYDTLDLKSEQHVLVRARTLYSCLSVVTSPDDRFRELYNNYTLHGGEDRREYGGYVTYYSRTTSGVGKVIAAKQELRPSIKVGAVGLGTGTLNWLMRPEDSMTFYEIDPKVEDIATTYFTYLDRDNTFIVLGDARKSMEAQEPQQYDVLVLDAFSGDAIPMHLLTREAGAVYKRHLKPDGALAIHITNRYADLEPVVRGLAADLGMSVAITQDDWSTWVTLTPGPYEPSGRILHWTDQLSSILSVMTY